jgi:hypothetical protein
MITPRIHAAGFPKQLAKVILGRRRRHGGGGVGKDGVGQFYDRRWFTAGPVVAADAPTVPLRFVKADGSSVVVDAREGESLLQTAHRFDIGLEGACEGGELYSQKCGGRLGRVRCKQDLLLLLFLTNREWSSSLRLLHLSLDLAAKGIRFASPAVRG